MGIQSEAVRNRGSRSKVFGTIPSGLILVMTLAVAIRLLYVLPLNPTSLSWSDESRYDKIAWHLAETGRFESSAYDAPPVLPGLLAIVYKVFGHNYRAARTCQALLSAAFVLAMFQLADMFFDRRTAYLTAVGVAFYPQFIYLSSVLYAEHTYLLLMALTVLGLARWQKQGRLYQLIVAGLLMGLTALCRPVFLLFFPFAAVYVWWQASPKVKLRYSLTVCAVAAGTILPWTIRNAMVFHRFVPISTGFGTHLWRGNNDVAMGDTGDRLLTPLEALWKQRAQMLLTDAQREKVTAQMEIFVQRLDQLDGVSRDRQMGAEAMRWIKAHPGKFLELVGRRFLTLYTAFSQLKENAEVANERNSLIAAFSFYPVLAFGIAGMILAARRYKASLLLHAVIASNLAAYLPMTACTRFRLPIDGYWIAFAAFAVVAACDRLTRPAGENLPPQPAIADKPLST